MLYFSVQTEIFMKYWRLDSFISIHSFENNIDQDKFKQVDSKSFEVKQPLLQNQEPRNSIQNSSVEDDSIIKVADMKSGKLDEQFDSVRSESEIFDPTYHEKKFSMHPDFFTATFYSMRKDYAKEYKLTMED